MVWWLACASAPGVGGDAAGEVVFEADDTAAASADTASDRDTASGDDTGTWSPALTDFDLRRAGGHDVVVQQDTVSAGGCSFDLVRYSPTSPIAQVVLSHGFLRAPDHMADLAGHLASWGLEVVTPQLCHSSLWDADHEANGVELAALADELGFTAPVFMGHSAGGVASVVAASEGSASAVVTLDLVEFESLAASRGAGLSVPVWGAFGESSSCNADTSGLDAVSASGGLALRVVGADHCDFEGPTDSLCTLFCEGSSAFSDSEISELIRALATAAVIDVGGLGDAATWWSAGSWYEQLRAEGRLEAL